MAFPSKRDPRSVLAAVALLASILAAVAFIVSSSPGVCASCHARQARSLASSAHRGVACYDCHLPAGGWSILQAKADEVFSMYPAFADGRSVPVGGVRISRAACLSCHHETLTGTSSASGLRVVHAECAAAPAKCDACHSDTAHPASARWTRRADMGDCIACHAAEDVTVTCRSCHTKEMAVSKPATGTLGVVHGSGWQETHAMVDPSVCSACHEASACVACHRTPPAHPVSFSLTHGKEALKPGATCSSCHKDPAACRDCHGLPMPHPADFRPQHSKVATSPADVRCRKCHTDYDCRDCHARHAHPTTTDGTIPSSSLPKSRSVPR